MKAKFQTKQSNSSQLKDLIELHSKTIYIPLDDMWENLIIPSGKLFSIIKDDLEIGFFNIDANGFLLQFYIIDAHKNEVENIFDFVLEQNAIKSAYAGSFEPEFQALALERATQTSIDTILYRALDYDALLCPVKGVERRLANMDDYHKVLEFCLEKVGLQGDWLQPYYQDLIPRHGVYLFELNDEIIGIGELRPSKSSPDYANLGMMVSKNWRKKNLGTYIMNQILILAKKSGMTGICSTTQENKASQKAILKAGLIPYHRILKIKF